MRTNLRHRHPGPAAERDQATRINLALRRVAGNLTFSAGKVYVRTRDRVCCAPGAG